MPEDNETSAGKSRSGSTSERILFELERRIVSGEIVPGSRIEDAVVAREFGVSRTPVRKALHQLVAAQLLTQLPNRSAIVPILDHEELSDLFETLAELEALGAGFATQRMREVERQELVACARACLACEDADDYASLNEGFHRRIDEGSRNKSLQEVVKLIRVRAAPYRRYQFADAQRLRRSSDEHMQIAEAISAMDAKRASAAMRSHINSASVQIMAMMGK